MTDKCLPLLANFFLENRRGACSPPNLLTTMAQGKCCGVVEEAAVAARERRQKRKQPWIVRKFMVPITLGIMGYAAYVYVGRLCVPMIKRKRDAGAGRGTGSEWRFLVCLVDFTDTGIVALLVVFAVLYLWVLWAYIKVGFLHDKGPFALTTFITQVIITPPGYAKDVGAFFPL